jgi:hypothetical protein
MMAVFTAVPLAVFVLCAIVLGAIALGGGIYETVLVDRVWPGNPAIIQPSRGGINRGLFWAPIHIVYEVALLVSAWAVWGDAFARGCIIVRADRAFRIPCVVLRVFYSKSALVREGWRSYGGAVSFGPTVDST